MAVMSHRRDVTTHQGVLVRGCVPSIGSSTLGLREAKGGSGLLPPPVSHGCGLLDMNMAQHELYAGLGGAHPPYTRTGYSS